MVTQITKGIKISVLTSFEGTYFKNYKIHFALVTKSPLKIKVKILYNLIQDIGKFMML